MHLPIPRLLSDNPSSPYRRSQGRRLRLGFGAIVQRKIESSEETTGCAGPPSPATTANADRFRAARKGQDRLVGAFTHHADLSPADAYQEARTRVRQFITRWYRPVAKSAMGRTPG
ncbi:MAG: hypothetical protein HC914_18425 [Chloroflexaceae bacterium]|nr:hypothetical protein [Chloroflexaceae bacterium]